MKIYRKGLLLIVCMMLCICACSKKDITYTNMCSKDTLSTTKTILLDHHLQKDAVETVMHSVEEYNATIGNALLIEEGTIDLKQPIPSYDETNIDENWVKENDVFIGYNCRITAFELMKDSIHIEDTTMLNSDPIALFMDEDALFNSKDAYFTEDELKVFEAFYSTIPTTSSTDVNEQYQVQKEYWDSIGVTFTPKDNVSLISVYIHNHYSEEENELLIGHTGVLLKENDGYVFFEKLSFQLPYQCIHFNDKKELVEYLMNCYDVDTTGECAKPFILENDTLLK